MSSAGGRISSLSVSINGKRAGQLLKASNNEFRYRSSDADQPKVSLLMPARKALPWQDGALFAVMDQHLPEGDLLLCLSARYPSHRLQPMHLLAMSRNNGIGRLGYAMPDPDPDPGPALCPSERHAILSMPFSQEMFDDLVQAHLETGAGVAGVQPKIMLADRFSAAIPTVIVKVAPLPYPGLVANEFLCLSAARRAGMATPGFKFSHDGHMLVVDRFDLVTHQGGGIERLGFEDIASLMGLRVRDALAERKYQGKAHGPIKQSVFDVDQFSAASFISMSTESLRNRYPWTGPSTMRRAAITTVGPSSSKTSRGRLALRYADGDSNHAAIWNGARAARISRTSFKIGTGSPIGSKT